MCVGVVGFTLCGKIRKKSKNFINNKFMFLFSIFVL
jgi:hypothetical protein